MLSRIINKPTPMFVYNYKTNTLFFFLPSFFQFFKEIQHVILDNILKFAALKPLLFQPYIPDFYIKLSVDRAGVRMKKLDMLTLLVSENNVQKLLIEFNEYVRHPDKLFVSSCVLAIGKIASALPEATGSCLFGLMALMSHPATPPNVVADSVVVMRRIMQQNKKEDIKNEKIWIDTLNTWKIEKIKREEERIATKLLEGEAVQDGEEVEEEDSPSSESESSSEEEDEGGKELSAKKKKKRAKKKAKKVAKKLKKKQKKAKKKAKKAKKKSKKLVEEDDESKYPRPVRNDPVVRVIHKLWQTTVPTARASIIWMIAEFQFKNEIKNFAPDALRRLAKSFKNEKVEGKRCLVKIQN